MVEGVELLHGDCLELMRGIPDGSVDLTVTSPPYDNLRTYNGYTFDFEGIAKELYRVTKQGGVVVWVVADATIKGSETGTSFRQALYFKDVCGFNLHDTMIWSKPGFTAVGALATRYAQTFEYMFIFTKGKLKTFNPLKDRPCKLAGKKLQGTIRQRDGSMRRKSNEGKPCADFSQRYNVWDITSRSVQGHPAPFPEALARDHILSWSNEGDTVLDPFLGSGTTGKMAVMLNRKFICIDISDEYLEVARDRINSLGIF